MLIIAGIAALICVSQGNFGGAVVALAIGWILHALLED